MCFFSFCLWNQLTVLSDIRQDNWRHSSWWLWNCANRCICCFPVRLCGSVLIRAGSTATSDFWRFAARIACSWLRIKTEKMNVTEGENNRTEAVHTSLKQHGAVLAAAQTMLLVVSHRYLCLKHLLLSVKADFSCCIQKHGSFKASFCAAAATFC